MSLKKSGLNAHVDQNVGAQCKQGKSSYSCFKLVTIL